MDDDGDENGLDVESLRSRSPGEEPRSPYDDVDISTLPGWWRRAIEEFDEHDLRPYQPPRFDDGELKRDVVDEIERRHDVTVRFVGKNVLYRENWEVRVDEDLVGEIGRRRDPEGYTVLEIESDEFVAMIERHLAPGDCKRAGSDHSSPERGNCASDDV